MNLQFVVKDENGKEIDWIDPVERVVVCNDVGDYDVPIDPRYTYELRERTDD